MSNVLAALADDARLALGRVVKGEDDAIAGWLAYGAALNEGRALLPGDREFGEWLRSSNLELRNGADVHPAERSAAMWAAANPEQFENTRALGKARTVRGIHALWQELEAEARRLAEEERRREVAEAGHSAAPMAEPAEAPATPAQPQEALAGNLATKGAAHDDAGAEVEARRTLAGLTREGLEDEVIGLRAENAELRAKLSAITAERDDFKAKLKEATSEDMGRALGNAQRQRDALKGRLDEKMAENARQARRIRHLEAEKNALQSKLENQEIEL